MSIKKYRGLCVSPGRAKGYVLNYNVNTISKEIEGDTIIVVEKLERDLLITLDPKIIGVIAEVGNIGSHGAGILRQLKIPCILRIANATSLFKDGEAIEIDGTTNTVLTNSEQVSVDLNQIENEEFITIKSNIRYCKIAFDTYNYHNISTNDFWFKPRPDRKYQRLRYEMIEDVYAEGTSYLYHIDSKTRHASDGCLEVYGVPTIESLCAFQLCNPDWFVEKAKERTSLFSEMKDELHQLSKSADLNNINCVINIYEKSMSLYRRLFKYLFLTQLHSDQFIELYLDFVECLTGQSMSADVLDLKSSYVRNCIQEKTDPGVFSKWDSSVSELYIWEGEIDFAPFQSDEKILKFIYDRPDSRLKLLKDYNAFRTIVPLMYQLSEEFFYMSKSINAFLSWSMQALFTYLNDTLELNFKNINMFYDLPLATINNYISQIRGGNKHEL